MNNHRSGLDLNCFMQNVAKHVRPDQALALLPEINYSRLVTPFGRIQEDMSELAELIFQQTSLEQCRAILAEFDGADDGGHCPVCYGKDAPVNVNGVKVVDLETEEVYEFRKEHFGYCPILLLYAMCYTADHC